MKLNVWIVGALAPLTAVMVLAQDTAPTPAAGAAAPAAATAPEGVKPAPAAPKKRSSKVKKKSLPSREKKVALNPPAAATVTHSDVNVRGQASFVGETLGHLQKGDTVTVLERITLGHPTKDEPAEWARITLPAGIPVWVDGEYVDAQAKTIKARRVHLRGGPGENYSVLGHLEKDAEIKEIKRKKGWVAIEAPTNAYAYVAAEFLEMQPPPALAVTPAPPAPTPTPAPPPAPAPAPQEVTVNTPPPPAPATSGPPTPAPVPTPPSATPAAAPVPAPAPPPPQQSDVDRELEALHRATAAEIAASAAQPPIPAPAQAPEPTPAPAVSTEPVTPRVVTREGFVRRAYNVQAPTDFELHDIQTGALIDYLQPKPKQNFKIFVGTRVTVTGAEGLDARWPRTPVLQVQNVDLMP